VKFQVSRGERRDRTGQQGAKMHLAVKGLVNELYLDDLRDKTHRGLSESVVVV
jgi:hypothetical protein